MVCLIMEFTQREELLQALRKQDWLLKEHMRKGMLLEDVVDQLWQLTEPDCNYYDLEEVVSYVLTEPGRYPHNYPKDVIS
jgi:hypothetical protein